MERALRLGGYALLAGLVGGCLWTARHQWFYGDDFALLSQVRELTPWDWWDPLGPHPWLFYRPLGMHTYYDVCLALFGLAPMPYLAVSVAAGAACAGVAASIARHLGLSPVGVGVTAIALLSMLASMGMFLTPTTFHYVAALLATALSLRLFLDGSRKALIASGVTLVAGLLCNEIAAIVPVAALALGLWPAGATGGARRLAGRIAPLAAIVAVYLLLRFTVLAGELPAGYGLALSGRVPAFAALQLSMSFGGSVRVLLVLALALALLVAARARVAVPGRALQGLGVWSLLALLPFSLMVMPRVPVPIALPVALALGTIADRFWIAWGERRALACAIAIGALAIALFPADRLAERVRDPRGAIGRELHAIIRRHVVDGRTTTFVVLHGTPELGGKQAMTRITWSLYGRGDRFEKAMFPASHGVRPVQIRFLDVSGAASLPPGTDRCVYLAARSGGHIELADAATVAALAPELRNRCDLRAG